MKTKRIESPFEDSPGSITIPTMLDAVTYQAWYERVNEIEKASDDKRHPIFQIWDCRFAFILDHDLDMEEGYEIERTGLKLPAVDIARWFVKETESLLEEAQDPKN